MCWYCRSGARHPWSIGADHNLASLWDNSSGAITAACGQNAFHWMDHGEIVCMGV